MTSDPTTDPRFADLPESSKSLVSYLSVPVTVRGEFAGQLAVATHGKEFTSEDRSVLERLVNVFSFFLQRYRTEQALVRQHLRLEQFVETIPIGVLFLDSHMRVFLVNPVL